MVYHISKVKHAKLSKVQKMIKFDNKGQH